MVHQFNIFLLLFGVVQGGLLSIWFFNNRRKDRSNLFIALLLFVVSLQLISKVITKMWLFNHAHIFYVLSYKLPYLVGPALYFFCKSGAGKKLSVTDLLHLLPFAVSSAFSLNIFSLYPHPYADGAFKLISVLVYTYWCLKIAPEKIRSFILLLMSAEAIIVVTLALMVVYYGRFPDVRILFVVLTLFIYWVSYKVIARSVPFREEANVVAMQSRKSQKYAHSSLRAGEAERIEKSLHQLMLNSGMYLDSNLTIDMTAEKLGTNRHNLSQVLNERLKKTWTDYLNDLRLEECRKRLSDPHNLRFTIASIAMDAGFNSVSNFNDVFKKKFGTTPSKFRDQLSNKMSA